MLDFSQNNLFKMLNDYNAYLKQQSTPNCGSEI